MLTYRSISGTIDEIIDELKDVWALSDILEIEPTNDINILKKAMKDKFGGILSSNGEISYINRMELFNRVDEMKSRLGVKNINHYKGVYVINNIQDYLQVLSKIRNDNKNTEFWYRGQPNARYQLLPNILRCAKEVASAYGDEYKPRNVSWFGRGQKVIYPRTIKMLEVFKKKAKNMINHKIETDIEWLFLAQHYGLLTPLLDWSEDPLVALFFSVNEVTSNKLFDLNIELEEYENYKRISEASAIFILEPGTYNACLPYVIIDENGEEHCLNSPIEVNEKSKQLISNYIYQDKECFLPICIKAPKKEYRISRQSGNFVFQGTNVKTIDWPLATNTYLYKLYIPYASIGQIKKELATLNITEKSIYGDASELDTFTKIIKDDEMKNFHKLIEEINQRCNSYC